MNSKDRYEIIGLCKISHFTKQPCRNVCYKCIKVAETMQYLSLTKRKIENFDLQQAFSFSSFAQILSASQPAVRMVPLGAGLEIFHRLRTVASDLQIF